MKVHVDQEKCQGHNRCFAIAPELFDVDDLGQSHELNDGVVAPAGEMVPWPEVELRHADAVLEDRGDDALVAGVLVTGEEGVHLSPWTSSGTGDATRLPALGGLLLLGRPTIRILFEHGEFDVAAGELTYRVLRVYAVALPAYVATEVVTRGLIALRDTRTPLLTNLVQLAGRGLLMVWLVGRVGVIAIPAALALTATLETVTLAAVLVWRLRRPPAHG